MWTSKCIVNPPSGGCPPHINLPVGPHGLSPPCCLLPRQPLYSLEPQLQRRKSQKHSRIIQLVCQGHVGLPKSSCSFLQPSHGPKSPQPSRQSGKDNVSKGFMSCYSEPPALGALMPGKSLLTGSMIRAFGMACKLEMLWIALSRHQRP